LTSKVLKKEAERFSQIWQEEFEEVYKMPKNSVDDLIRRATAGIKAYNRVLRRAKRDCPNLIRNVAELIYLLHRLTK